MNDPRFEPVVRPPEILFRAWRVEESPKNGGVLSLYSIIYKVPWPGKGLPLSAECRNVTRTPALESNNHSAPDPDHRCGIYAVKTIEQCRKWAGDADFPKKLAAIGEVALWGRIWQCDNGVRAQFAKPNWIRLLLPVPEDIDAEEVAAELAEFYHVPVHAAPPPW